MFTLVFLLKTLALQSLNKNSMNLLSKKLYKNSIDGLDIIW